MLGILVALLLVVPVVELAIIVAVATEIGVAPTIVLLVAVSAAGAWLLKQQGAAAWARFRLALARGEVPADEVVDGMLVVFGGALLLTPGFATDVIGLFLLVPATRALAKNAGRRVLGFWAGRRFGVAFGLGRRAYEARVTKVRRRPVPDDPPTFSPPGSAGPAPFEKAPGDAAGSRDTG